MGEEVLVSSHKLSMMNYEWIQLVSADVVNNGPFRLEEAYICYLSDSFN